MSDGMEKPCQLIAGFSDEEWSLFLKECRRDPDKVSNKIHWQCKADHGQASLHYSGFPYDPTLFSETKFSIISETWWWKETKFRVTEKTWKTIENNHPFIMASAPGALKYLRDRGFNTFENYLPIPDYNDPIQSFNRLEAVIENTEYLLKHDLDLEEEVTQNKKRYLEIVQEAHETIYEILRDRFKILPREREY
jgi:hypothetical protein